MLRAQRSKYVFSWALAPGFFRETQGNSSRSLQKFLLKSTDFSNMLRKCREDHSPIKKKLPRAEPRQSLALSDSPVRREKPVRALRSLQNTLGSSPKQRKSFSNADIII
jgi:hypothetical protein